MKRLMSLVLTLLGVAQFSEVEGKKVLTEEQRTQLAEAMSEEFAADFAVKLASEPVVAVAPVVPAGANTDIPDASAIADLQATIDGLQAKLLSQVNATAQVKTSLAKKISSLESQIEILSAMEEADPTPTPANGANVSVDITASETHLFAQQVPYMAIDTKHNYNKRAYAAMMSRLGMDIPSPKASSMDYASLGTDLGDFFRIRKQDSIQSFLIGLPSLENIFPLESDYQDQAVLVNMFLNGDFSQSDNTNSTFSSVVKGGYKFEPEILNMYPVMFAHQFTDLKAIEKSWIGYLNKEGSSTMKMSFIEYILVETGKKLANERELRRVNGIRVDPSLNVPGTAMGAANGLRQFIRNQIGLFKIRPFELGEWSETTIADHVRIGTSKVPTPVRDTGNLKLYMSVDAFAAYVKNLESLYGTNMDYKPNTGYIKEYPNVPIVIIPNFGDSKRLIWTLSGNISLFEDKPGEMFQFSLEQQDWTLKVWSNWKESIWAYLVGKKFSSLEEIPLDYSTQMIFCNDVDYAASFFIQIADGDTTPTVALHNCLISGPNTVPTVITNIDNAIVGVPITIRIGSSVNPPTIAKSGAFSTLTAAWEPSLGESIILVKTAANKFIDMERIPITTSFVAVDEDDSTPDVAGGTDFVTNVNTVATAITDLDNAIYNRIYTFYGTGDTHASTIANAGNFSLSAAMTLSAGHWIKLQKNKVDGKFYEISRG